MVDAIGLWESIQALTGEDRKWLFTQLTGWLPFRHFLASRQREPGDLGPATVVFDGGSRGNPGPAYGTYALQFGDESPQLSHLEFKEKMTNNEAEYEALIRGLQDLRGRIAAMGADPRSCEVVVQGDSRLVINQVTGAWKARDPRMLQRRNCVRELVRSFGRVSFQQRRREEIEEVLGH